MAMSAVRKYIWLPAKGGVSNVYPPPMLINRKSLDWNKEFQFEFGSYVQAYKENKPKNNNKARALDGIYLGPIQDNNQGGHKIMDLFTGREIKRLQVVEVVMMELVVKRVE